MFYLYLVYGAAFFAAGVLLGFQARLPTTVVPRNALWWFSAFALLHACFEWAKMSVVPRGEPVQEPLWVIVLGVASFATLAQFGVVALRTSRQWPRWSLAVPGLLFAGWLAIVVAWAVAADFDNAARDALDAASRYAFAVPASSLAAWAFWAIRGERREGDVIRSYLGWASGVFVAYAIFAGVLVTPAAFFPASHVNASALRALTHVPVEVPRMLCALAIAAVLSKALVIEVARQARELSQRREEFISVVAHDLRNPIGSIHLSAELLERRLGELAEPGRQQGLTLLRHIRTGTCGLERMVRDLLDASRIETHQLALELRDLAARPLICSIVERASGSTCGRDVRLVLPDLLPDLHADPLRVEQILVNLLSNAAKYSAANTDIVIEAIVQPHAVELAVTNYGGGLSAEEIDKVFSRFYRCEEHARRVDGLGLGLYIAKGLVEAQGGTISVDSELGSYATFRFTLPTSATPHAMATDRERATAPPPRAGT